MSTQEGLSQALEQVQVALRQFVNADPAAYKELWSRANDVTFFGGWGAYEHGWEQVGPRLDWAVARFRGGHLDFEMLAAVASGELAYTVWIEKGDVRVIGHEESRPLALRVTHIYRWEVGTWKIMHRHADPIMDKTEPGAV